MLKSSAFQNSSEKERKEEGELSLTAKKLKRKRI
jgi:hypothetical protein